MAKVAAKVAAPSWAAYGHNKLDARRRSVIAEIVAAAEMAAQSNSDAVKAFAVKLLGRIPRLVYRPGCVARTMSAAECIEWANTAIQLMPDVMDIQPPTKGDA